MQDASLATDTMASLSSVPGPQNLDESEVMVNTLVAQHCAVVFAADPVEVAAVERRAASFPEERFVVVGSGPSAANLQRIDGQSGALRWAAARAMQSAVAAASPR